MVLDSLLAGVMLFSSFAARTSNVQPNPDDYEISVGLNHNNYHINRQWERELGEKYIDDLVWIKIENHFYILSYTLILSLTGCQLKEPAKNHGILFLENRSKQLVLNKSNQNDALGILLDHYLLKPV